MIKLIKIFKFITMATLVEIADDSKKIETTAEESITNEIDIETNVISNELDLKNEDCINCPEIELICIPSFPDVLLLDDYQEPLLISQITSSYNGFKKAGLLHGYCEVTLNGGHNYKGDFCDGLMHGNGVYTWADGTTYEGDFTNNQIKGFGIFTWPNKSMYEGEIDNGHRHGNGKFVFNTGLNMYIGNWNQGQIEGHGKLLYDKEGTSYYEGAWVKGKREGRGLRRYASGDWYEGDWMDNLQHGKGKMVWMKQNMEYEGDWTQGAPNGVGTYKWYEQRSHISQYKFQNSYRGDVKCNEREGFGIFMYADGSTYEGGWKNNLKHGKGKLTFKNGQIYEGEFEENKIVKNSDDVAKAGCHGDECHDNDELIQRTMTPSDLCYIGTGFNKFAAQFYFEFDFLFEDGQHVDWAYQNREIVKTISRHATELCHIYSFYARIGRFEFEMRDNVFSLDELRFMQLLKDAYIHHYVSSFVRISEWIGKNERNKNVESHPLRSISYNEFIEDLVIISHCIYKEKSLSESFEKLITENLLKHSCQLKGNFFNDPERLSCVLTLIQTFYSAYKDISASLSTSRSITWRDYVFLIKDIDLFSQCFTVSTLLDIIKQENPNIVNENEETNLELPVHFSDFLEVTVAISQLSSLEKPNQPTITNFDPNKEMDDNIQIIAHDENTEAVLENKTKNTEEGVLENKTKIKKQPRICYQPMIIQPYNASEIKEANDWSKKTNQFVLTYFQPIVAQIIAVKLEALDL